MKILILENNKFLVESKSSPEIGKHYSLEDAISGSKAQNNLFHSLIDCLYKWMLSTDNFVHENNEIVYDFRCADPDELKNKFKQKYGAGADHYRYVDCEYQIIKVKNLGDIPPLEIQDFIEGNKGRINVVLKSWSQYTKNQRTKLIDTTINIMDHIGVDSKKYFTIMEGIKDND